MIYFDDLLNSMMHFNHISVCSRINSCVIDMIFLLCQFFEISTFIIILSHCGFQGRPKGVTPKYSLKPLVPRLSELLGVQVCLHVHMCI